jgi:CheY-like chemotaxis protein
MPKTVLIVEDHDDIRHMTRYMVESFGYNVIEARDGYEALEEAKDGNPDLILMDIAMPIMNGITSATLIRNSGKCSKTPIIAVTAYGKEYVNMAGEFGFDKVMQKPVVLEEMGLLLDSYLGHEV